MAKHLIIPDIHERLDKLEKALTHAGKADFIIQLGDWFDSFDRYSEERIRDVCRKLNQICYGYRWEDGDLGSKIIPTTMLLGNHDCHYFFDNPQFACSGYHPSKKFLIKELIPLETIRRFKLYAKVGPYLISHAGFNSVTIQYADPIICAHAIQDAMIERFDPLFGAGRARGGNQKYGGPTWLDWQEEFEALETPQIVGHTNGKEVRTKQTGDGVKSYCLDTALHHCAMLDDVTGEVEIIEL